MSSSLIHWEVKLGWKIKLLNEIEAMKYNELDQKSGTCELQKTGSSERMWSPVEESPCSAL